MAVNEIKQAIVLYLVDVHSKDGNPDWPGIADLFVKTKNQQKAILLAWATAKKAALNAQKANLGVVKTLQEGIIDSEIANIVDMESNF